MHNYSLDHHNPPPFHLINNSEFHHITPYSIHFILQSILCHSYIFKSACIITYTATISHIEYIQHVKSIIGQSLNNNKMIQKKKKKKSQSRGILEFWWVLILI